MKKTLLFIMAAIVMNTAASASYISLNTTTSLKVEGGRLQVGVSSVNKGDESAYNVQAEIRVGERTLLTDKVTELPVDGTYRANASLPAPSGKPGNYPLFLTMHYADANQYPFSALTCLSFAYQQETLAPFFGQLSSATLVRQGKVKLVLKNISDRPVTASVYLIAPREFSYKAEPVPAALAPRSEKTIEFQLDNFSALAGSTYQVYAVAEGEDESSHYTSVSPGTVKVVASQAIYGMSYTIIFGVLVLLLAVFIASQFFRKNEKSN